MNRNRLRRDRHRLRCRYEDQSSLFLDLKPQQDIVDMIESLKNGGINHASPVETVYVYFHKNFGLHHGQELPSLLVSLLETIAKYIPNLLELKCMAPHNHYYPIPVRALSLFLQNASRLSTFSLANLILCGNTSTFTDYAKRLQSHGCLREFNSGAMLFHSYEEGRSSWTMDTTTLAVSQHDSICRKRFIQPIVEALASNSNLQVIAIQGTDLASLQALWTSKAVALLLRSQSLRKVLQSQIYFDNDDIVQISHALAKNDYLEELFLGCHHLDDTGGEALAQALQYNTNLEKLKVRIRHLEDEACILRLAKALSGAHIREFGLYGDGYHISSNSQAAFLEVAKTNFHIEEFDINMSATHMQFEIDLYLKLNQLGRFKLLNNVDGGGCRGQWVEALALAQDDLDCLFYLLSMNPSICR